MQTSVDIGRYGIWQGVLDQQPSARVRELAAEIEAMGWPTLWLPVGKSFATITTISASTPVISWGITK